MVAQLIPDWPSAESSSTCQFGFLGRRQLPMRGLSLDHIGAVRMLQQLPSRDSFDGFKKPLGQVSGFKQQIRSTPAPPSMSSKWALGF